jgi:hypothetical protein
MALNRAACVPVRRGTGPRPTSAAPQATDARPWRGGRDAVHGRAGPPPPELRRIIVCCAGKSTVARRRQRKPRVFSALPQHRRRLSPAGDRTALAAAPMK